MFLKTLNLTNFRNYSHLTFNFKNKITVLIGDNAQGKSNFLEAIYFLAVSKSPKADKDEELIRQGEDFLRIEGEVGGSEKSEQAASDESSADKSEESERVNLEIAMQLVDGRLKKRVKVNGVPRRTIDYVSNLTVILFAPEDINLVTGSPSLRRNHLDQLLSQIDRDYKKSLTNYENVVVRKNRVLQAVNEGLAKTDQLIYWSQQQILSGSVISHKRREFFKFVNSVEKKFGNFEFEYAQSVITADKLKEYQGREVAVMNSLIGPHRDDFSFLLMEKEAKSDSLSPKDLAKFGSRGEQRTSVMDLKIAEAGFAESVLGTRPILLLDDIFSELDEEHRLHAITLAGLQQTVIATVDFDDFLQKALKGTDLYNVKSGNLVKRR